MNLSQDFAIRFLIIFISVFQLFPAISPIPKDVTGLPSPADQNREQSSLQGFKREPRRGTAKPQIEPLARRRQDTAGLYYLRNGSQHRWAVMQCESEPASFAYRCHLSAKEKANETVRISLDEYHTEAAPPCFCLKADRRGRIYFADRSNYTIRIFSPSGKSLGFVGGSGQGPGEFQRWFGQFDVSGDGRIFQVDFFGGNRRITHFSPNRRLIASVPIKDPATNGAGDIIVLKDGKLALSIIKNPSIENKNPFLVMNMTIAFSIADKKGNIEQVLTKTKYPASFSDSRGSGWPNIPFAPEFLCAYCLETHTVVCLVTHSPRMRVFHLSTQTSRNFNLKDVMEPVTKADIQEYIRERKKSRRSFRLHEHIFKLLSQNWQKFIACKPVIQRIFFNPEGELFIVIKRNNAFTVQKFSRDFNSYQVKEMQAIPAFIGKTRLYFLEYDEDNDCNYIEIKHRKNIGDRYF